MNNLLTNDENSLLYYVNNISIQQKNINVLKAPPQYLQIVLDRLHQKFETLQRS